MTCDRLHLVGIVGTLLALLQYSPAVAQVADPQKLLAEADRLAWLRVWTRAEPLYAKAREGLLPTFTGLTDPYEPPSDADLVIDMTSCSSEQAATTILRRLRNDGYLAAMPDGFTGPKGPEHLSLMA